MKVLLTTPGGAGHVQPMIPLATALVARGNEVRWALPERAAPAVEAVGVNAAPVAFAVSTRPDDLLARFPELRDLPPAVRPDFMFAKLFGATHTPVMLAGLTELTRTWQPDLVVADAAELASHIVAAELGVPSVTKGFGPMLPQVRYERALAEIAPLWTERGLEPRPLCGVFDTLYLDIYPPELASWDWPTILPRRQSLRPVSDNGPAVDGPLPLPPGDGPLVYVTMGTVFNNPAFLAGVVTALADLGVRTLVTVGTDGDPATLGDLPSHVRVERYVPQTQVLPRAAVVVSHAGSGTALTSLALGLPQLCLPQGADQFLNAGAIAKAGAGLWLAPDAATPDAVQDAVRQLLDDPAYRSAAQRIGTSIAAMPSPDDVAGVLESLVT